MSTRRAFLQSALFLPSLLSAAAFAQDNKAATPFADFEGGSWGDWTVEGEAFGASPATDALFPGKIRGFGGNGFVCTLHPKKGNAATGKAVSREFTIEKPFITFKIGGGAFPGAACLNLVVDGRVTHTATGNGTATLSDASWDVSDLVGNKAHFEIVDSTTSDQRGYVMVDDIEFTQNSQLRSAITGDPSRLRLTAEQRRTIDFFLQHASDPRIRDGNYDGYGIPNAKILEISGMITLRVIQPDLDHIPGRSVGKLAHLIKTAVQEVTANLKFKPNTVLAQRFVAQGICDWVRTHVLYNEALSWGEDGQYILPREVRSPFWTSAGILAVQKPYCVCAGYARLTLDLSTEAGIKCHLVNGYSRPFGKPVAKATSTHSWNLFEDENGYVIPADMVKSGVPLDVARQMQGRIDNPFALPLQMNDFGLFLCADGAMDYDGRKQIPNHLVQSNLSIEEWAGVDTRVLVPVIQSTYRREAFIYEIPKT